ncbi:MAG TPA: monooxygenase, partial [Micromonospora sp.]
MGAVPELVTLHVWRIGRRALPGALGRMAVGPRRLRATPGVRFGKLLGTGTGTGFGPGDADLTRWAALVVWDDPARAAGFDDSPVGRSWCRIARASVRL